MGYEYVWNVRKILGKCWRKFFFFKSVESLSVGQHGTVSGCNPKCTIFSRLIRRKVNKKKSRYCYLEFPTNYGNNGYLTIVEQMLS